MAIDIIRPANWEVAGLGLLTVFYLLAGYIVDDVSLGPVNTIGSGVFGAILCGGALRIALIDWKALWLSHFWLRLSCGIYYGFGTFLRFTFNDYTNHTLDSYYWVQPYEIYKVNLICSLGAFIFFLVNMICATVSPFVPAPPLPKTVDRSRLLLFCAVVYCVLGYSVKYAIVVPYTLNAYGANTLSGTIANMTYLASVGLFLLTVWCARYQRRLLILPTALLLLDVSAGMLQLAKMNVILPLILYLLGLIGTFASIRTLAASALLVWTVFATLMPAVLYGRAQIEMRTGNINLGDAGLRAEVLVNYFTDTTSEANEASQLNATARLYYAHAMAAAAARYDQGDPGKSIYNVFTILIPRWFWPEKPVYAVGSDFNLMVVGDPNSSTWMGIFAEAYWCLGWLGLPIVLIPLALAFERMSRVAYDVLQRERWLHFPAVIIGAWCGMRSDTDIATTQFVSFFMVSVLVVLADYAEPFVEGLIGARQSLAADPNGA